MAPHGAERDVGPPTAESSRATSICPVSQSLSLV